MNFMWRHDNAEATDDEMARATSTLNRAAIDSYSLKLEAAKTDRGQFEAAYNELTADKALKSPDLVAIAKAYAGAAKRITSKKAALDAIRKRFVELVRFDAKNGLAARSRPW